MLVMEDCMMKLPSGKIAVFARMHAWSWVILMLAVKERQVAKVWVKLEQYLRTHELAKIHVAMLED
jgi:hypothetical protein